MAYDGPAEIWKNGKECYWIEGHQLLREEFKNMGLK